uniref:Uncharacterized protein n=1 Tax=Salix viminalis TaxID=40686 RepID=A0A6N2KAQ9_SALVM
MCPPFVECPARFTGLLAYQALARCSCRPLDGRSARYPDSLLGPTIARAISYGSSSSQPRDGARHARPEWAQRSAPIRITLGGLSLLPDLERYYESSVPDSIAAAIWFTGTTKKSHAYVTVIDGLIILDHEDPGRASGFHSHHHIDGKSPRAPP